MGIQVVGRYIYDKGKGYFLFFIFFLQSSPNLFLLNLLFQSRPVYKPLSQLSPHNFVKKKNFMATAERLGFGALSPMAPSVYTFASGEDSLN